jgi:hypothetical protein
MFRELCIALLPSAGLPQILDQWPSIAKALADQPRKRARYVFR